MLDEGLTRVVRKISAAGLKAIAGMGETPGPAVPPGPGIGPRCPWVGVPIPGKRPAMVVHRERLQTVLQGIVIDGSSVTEARNAQDKRLKLRIWGHTPGQGNGRRGTLCQYTFYDVRHALGFYKFPSLELTVKDWAEHVRESRQKAQARAQVPQEQRSQEYKARRVAAARKRLEDGIKRQERSIQKHKRELGSYRPRCLFLGQEDRERSREGRGDWQAELDWRLEHSRRRKLGWAVAQVRARFKTNKDRYAALEALGFPLQKWSEKTATQWERYYKFDGMEDYWRWAYRIQGSGCGARKPYRDKPWGIYDTIRGKYPTPWHQENALKERLAQHRKDLEQHAQWWRELKSLEYTLEALWDELRAFDEGNGPECKCTACGSVLEGMPGTVGAVGWCPSCETERTLHQEEHQEAQAAQEVHV